MGLVEGRLEGGKFLVVLGLVEGRAGEGELSFEGELKMEKFVEELVVFGVKDHVFK